MAGLGDLALAPLPGRGQAVESVVDGTRLGRCPPTCGRVALARCLAGIALGMTDHDLLLATGLDGCVHDLLLVGEVAVTARGHAIPLAALVTARGHGCGRFFPLTVRGQRIKASEPDMNNGRVWRQTVTVFQAPVVSEASATVAPPVVGGAVTALPSAVQDLARFFLSLTGSSSQGAVGSVAGASVPTSGVSASAGGAATSCAATVTSSVAARPPSDSAAVPGSSGRQQRDEELSCCSRHRRRSSRGRTGRASKKRPRERSPSPGRSSRHREESYRSSSSPSEEDRAESPPPSSGRVPGGTPGDSRPAPAGDRSPRPGSSGWRPWSSAAVERYHAGFGNHLSSPPPGKVDDDRSSVLDSLEIDRDDSFRSVLALIQNFHSMEEPASVPSARCKTSLASIYGFDVGDLSVISLAHLSLAAVASGRH